jgi:hypothetical protein
VLVPHFSMKIFSEEISASKEEEKSSFEGDRERKYHH